MGTFENAETAHRVAATDIDWASAYQELLPKVYHYFCLRTGDSLEAEDLTAATFERAWRDRARYQKDIGTVTNWIFGIARHVAITHFRQKEHRQALTQANTEEYRPTEEAAARQQEFDRLASLLTTLSEREREIFSLKYGGRFTNRAIAKIARLTESNVGTILHRIVSRLRERLEKET